MADFRKWLFAFAVVALMLGLQAPASAQGFGTTPAFTCVANAGVPPIVRSQGVTELVGDLVLNCTGGTPTPAGAPIPTSNVQIFLNTNVTSRLLNSSNLSEATLLIDEPFPTNANPTTATSVPNAPTQQLVCQATGNIANSGVQSNPCGILGVGSTPGGASSTNLGPVGANGPYNGTPGHYNVFQGTQNGANSVVWNGVPIDSPGTNGANQLNTRVIRITNVRANACLLGLSSTLVPTQIVMYVSVNGSQQVTINNPQQTVAFIQNGFAVGNKTGSYAQCNNLNISSGSVSFPSSYTPIATTITEGFASSFKVRNYGQIQAVGTAATTGNFTAAGVGTNALQNVPGFNYNTESGFYYNATGTVGTPGLADTGTQISISFAGVGAGVQIAVPASVPLVQAGTTVQTGLAVLVGGSSGTIGGLPSVSISGTTGTVTYEVVYSNPNVIESMVVPTSVAFVSNTSQNLPGVGQTTEAVNFAPLSTTPTASTGPIPRFCQNGTASNIFAINLCSCNLLFPFVTNQAGFDTGIAIANTSVDPFGTVNQAGTVKLFYYGNTAGGGAAPATQTSQTVTAGSELVFNLSGGGNLGVAATPGFQGYMIATANFQWCHGFAFISDLGAQKLAEGYLAIQLDLPGLNRTGQIGEVQAH